MTFVLQDRFDDVFGSSRGRAGAKEIAESVPTKNGLKEVAYLLQLARGGDFQPALLTLQEHKLLIGQAPLLHELAQGLALTQKGINERQRIVIRQFMNDTGFKTELAPCIVEEDNSTVHYWADGENHPYQETSSPLNIDCACGKTIVLDKSKSLGFSTSSGTHIPRIHRGSFAEMPNRQCQGCLKALGSSLPEQITERRDYDPFNTADDDIHHEELFLKYLIQEIIRECTHFRVDDSEGVLRSATLHALQWSLGEAAWQMRNTPDGEKALSTVLGPHRYKEHTAGLKELGHNGPLFSLISTHAWSEGSRLLLPFELDKVNEHDYDEVHLAYELSMHLARQQDSIRKTGAFLPTNHRDW